MMFDGLAVLDAFRFRMSLLSHNPIVSRVRSASLYLFHIYGNRGIAKLNNWPKVKQLGCSRAKIHT